VDFDRFFEDGVFKALVAALVEKGQKTRITSVWDEVWLTASEVRTVVHSTGASVLDMYALGNRNALLLHISESGPSVSLSLQLHYRRYEIRQASLDAYDRISLLYPYGVLGIMSRGWSTIRSLRATSELRGRGIDAHAGIITP